MRRALVLLSLGLLACAPAESKEDLRVEPPKLPQKDLEAPPLGTPFEATEALGDDLSPQVVRGCQSDSDCVVSCRVDGDCCEELCDCTQVYNQSFLTELTAYQDASCKEASCPVAKCKPPPERTAVCRSGLCELEEPVKGP
jgi:hypothetical protein